MDATARPRRIFIVEDDALLLLGLQQQLARLGYAVCGVARDSRQALEAIPKDPPDVLLTDIRLDEAEEGIELARQCRERFGLPAVFLTGYSDPETVSHAAVAQPYSFLVKPCSDRELRAALEIALYRHAMDRELARYRERLEELVQERTRELEERNKQLQAALEQVKKLEGCITMCAYCRRVRDGSGRWEKLEEYVEEHSEVGFSHGLCPECYSEQLSRIKSSPKAPKA